MSSAEQANQPVEAKLGLWDAISIIIGIIIGATIYETPWLIYSNVTGVGWALGVWILGGFLSLIGAFCYAELATAYPRSGGDYNYLTRAFGSWMGFLWSWAQLTVIHTGGIGMLAYIFADYTHRLFWGKTETGKELAFLFAGLSVVVLTALNLVGIILGKRTQNVLTVAKVLGLGGIVVGGLLWAQSHREFTPGKVVSVRDDQVVLEVGKDRQRTYTVAREVDIAPLKEGSKFSKPEEGKEKPGLAHMPVGASVVVVASTDHPDRILRIEEVAESDRPQLPSFGFAMVLVFLAFSGYNDAAYVAAEVRNQRRNLPWALILGVGLATVIYLVVNVAYLYGLGLGDARRSKEIAADVLRLFLGPNGEKAMCLVVMISALGAINGSILTGSRVFSTLGADHRLFSWMGGWNLRAGVPVVALLTQGMIALVMIVVVGTAFGQEAINDTLAYVGMEKLSWEGHGGFETLLKFTTPIFWVFFLLTSLSLFVLRERDPHVERPFLMPLYPLLPLIFTGTCVYMLQSGINYAGNLGLVGAGLLFIGLVLYGLSSWGSPPHVQKTDNPVA